ncbi:MAG: hypothetical protein WD042_09020 [Phycisphaeraceae bacterium]
MIKKLTRQGHSSALIIDRTMMNLMDIDRDTPLKVTVRGRKLIVEPLTDAERRGKFKELLEKDTKRNAKLYRRLAK